MPTNLHTCVQIKHDWAISSKILLYLQYLTPIYQTLQTVQYRNEQLCGYSNSHRTNTWNVNTIQLCISKKGTSGENAIHKYIFHNIAQPISLIAVWQYKLELHSRQATFIYVHTGAREIRHLTIWNDTKQALTTGNRITVKASILGTIMKSHPVYLSRYTSQASTHTYTQLNS